MYLFIFCARYSFRYLFSWLGESRKADFFAQRYYKHFGTTVEQISQPVTALCFLVEHLQSPEIETHSIDIPAPCLLDYKSLSKAVDRVFSGESWQGKGH